MVRALQSLDALYRLALIVILLNTSLVSFAEAKYTPGDPNDATAQVPLFTETGEPWVPPVVQPAPSLPDQQNGLLEMQLPNQGTVPTDRAGFTCNSDSLSPQERQALWDETLKKGFVGKDYGSGTPAKDNRKSLPQDTVVIPDAAGKLGLKQQLPNQKIDPEEIQHLLRKHCTNCAFAFGILLTDTMRAGRCTDLNSGCALVGQKLQLRNGGAGIIANYKNVFNDLWNWVKPDDANNAVEGIAKKDLDNIKAELIQTADLNTLPLKTAQRVPGKIIPNSMLGESFSANMNSVCNEVSCYLNTYSMFDKMFNAYSSGTMLFTSFGPTFVNQAGRAFNFSIRRLRPAIPPKFSAFGKRIRSLYMLPDSWYMKNVTNLQYRRIRAKALDFDNTLVGAKAVLEGGGFDAWWNPTFKKELAGITDPMKKADYFRYVTDLRKVAHSYELSRQLSEEEFDVVNALVKKGELALTDPRYVAAKRKFAYDTGKLWRDIDDITGIDVPQWHFNHKSVNFQKYAVKTNTGDFVQPAVDSDFYDILLKKMKDGHFDFTAADLVDYRQKFASSNGKLLLYTVEPAGKQVTTITRDTLEDAVSKGNLGNMFARLDEETYVPLEKSNLRYILGKTTGDIQVFRGGYKPTREMSVDELSDLILGDRGAKPVRSFARNMDTIDATLRENGWQMRNHWGSLLDRYFAQHSQVLKTYLTDPKGALFLTAYPFAFWGAKRGFGQESFSLYQLPDEWQSLTVSHGRSSLFNNSFIDFFANDGSDQGDVFVAFLNKLPWKLILNELSKAYNPVHDAFRKFTENELRNKTGNLAVYVSGPKDCSNCQLTLETKDYTTFSPFFSSPATLESFILEDTPADQKDVGQTLIAYASKTNLNGNTSEMSTTGGGIDLETAIREKETCLDKVAEMNGKIPSVLLIGKLLPNDAKVGGALAFGETLGYALFTWTGFLGSAFQQTILTPTLQDCVDTQEGYFIHFFAPAQKKEEANKQTPGNLNTTKVSDAISEASDKLLGSLKGNSASWTEKAADETKQKIDSLTQNANTKDLVEAILKIEGSVSGQFSGSNLFYLWMQGGSELTPSSYQTKGKEELKDGNTTITNDFAKGQVLVNGKPVITNPDTARLASVNTNGPFMEYPNTLTKVGLPSTGKELVFQTTVEGRTYVRQPQVLDCIRAGVLAQTGVGMDSDDLTEVFGLTDAIVTDTHPNVYFQPEQSRIMAEGIPRKAAEGKGSLVNTYSDANVELVQSLDGDNSVGKLKSIQFRNGVIIYKPETHELIIWLKHNEKTILNQNDVAGLRATPTTSTNPLTNCPEPALDLSVSGDPSSEQATFKAQQFNQSLQQMGPYKIFDTPSKRFIFYSGPAPTCEPRFKIIDKATGEVLTDQPIKSIEATPNGVRVTTADGKTHDLGFSVENGKPILTYNGQAEPLLSAQGDKGAFWYDPQKGLWYTENAQLLPLLEAFRNNGLSTQVGADGKVSTTATGNMLNLNIGSGTDSGLNLPSVPENPLLLAFFVLSLVGVLVVIRAKTTG